MLFDWISIYVSIALAFIIVTLSDILAPFNTRVWFKIVAFAILSIPVTTSLVGYGPLDFVSAFFAFISILVGLCVAIYVDSYEMHKYRGRNLRLLIDMFTLSIFAVFASPHLISFIMFWLLAEIIGFFAIVFEIERRTLVAGLRYLIVSMVPADIALMALLAIAVLSQGFREAMVAPMSGISSVLGHLDPVLSILIVLGFLAKAAVAPLHFWLPDAHSLAPAPASALLSGIMVKMGIYGVVRVLPAIDNIYTPLAMLVFASLTVVYGGLQALVQTDIKRLLAYSTIENTSLMTLALAAYKMFGIQTLWIATLVLVAAHALFKASLFMDSGVVEIITHTRELPKLGYLARVAPLPSSSTLISVLSLLGVPPTVGFLAKLYLFMGLIEVLYLSPGAGTLLLIVAALGSALAIAYGIKYLTVYWGSINVPTAIHVPRDRRLYLGELVLAVLSIVVALPIYAAMAIQGLVALEPVYITVFGVVQAMFVALMYYIYSHTYTYARETHWLGGAVP